MQNPGICPKVLALLLITLQETLIRVDKVDLLVGGSEEVICKSCCHSTLTFSSTYLAKQSFVIFEHDRENHRSSQLVVVDRKTNLSESLFYQLTFLDQFILDKVVDAIEVKDLLVRMVN